MADGDEKFFNKLLNGLQQLRVGQLDFIEIDEYTFDTIPELIVNLMFHNFLIIDICLCKEGKYLSQIAGCDFGLSLGRQQILKFDKFSLD